MGRADLQVPDDAASDREPHGGGARPPREGDRAGDREAAAARAGVASAFRPPWWCRTGHVQTIWGPLVRRDRLRWRRERVATSDDDFVDLDWTAGEVRPDAPVLLILHGLEGSSRSHYAVGLAREALARSWRAVVLNFRSCSGELNRRPQFYHSGHTDDLDDVVRGLVAREPATRLAAVGVSLGGNVLLKWLGEREAKAPAQLVGAVAISAPFDLVPCARGLDQGLRRRVYTANFLRTMRAKAAPVVDRAARDRLPRPARRPGRASLLASAHAPRRLRPAGQHRVAAGAGELRPRRRRAPPLGPPGPRLLPHGDHARSGIGA